MDEKFLVHFVGIDRTLLDLLPFLSQSGQRGISYAVRKALYREIGFEILHRFQLARTYEVVDGYDPENPLLIIDGRKARLVISPRYSPGQMWRDINEDDVTRFYFILTPPFFKRKFEEIAKDSGLSIYRLFLPDRRYSPATEEESIIGDDSVSLNFTSMIINGDFHYHDNSTHIHGSGNSNCGNTYSDSNNCGNSNSNNTSGNSSNSDHVKSGSEKISRLKRGLWKGIGIVSEVIFRQICCTMLKGILNA